MGFLNSSREKNRVIALFDIGSGSVGGAILHMKDEEGELPTIISTTRTPLKLHDQLDFQALLRAMTHALRHTAETLYYEKVGTLDEIICVLASPWYTNETRTLKMSRERQFIFTDRLANDLLQKEINLLKEAYTKNYDEISQPEFIEKQVIDVSLDGVKIDKPIDKQTKAVEMNIVVTLSTKLCTDTIRKELAQFFHHTPISFSSFLTSSYLAVRDRYNTLESYLLVDIGGEITDISTVSDSVLKDSASFPFGSNTLFKKVAEKLSLDKRDAEELINLYSAGLLEENRVHKLEKVLLPIEENWKDLFYKCIGSLVYTQYLPNTVFLTTDTALQAWFTKTMSSHNELKSLTSDNRLHVIPIEGPELLNMCRVKGGSCDPFLMVEAIALARKSTAK